MLRIKVSQLHQSEIVNVGKILYTIELNADSQWIFRKADTKIIISRDNDKKRIIEFAKLYCNTHNAELYIKNESGNIEDIVNF